MIAFRDEIDPFTIKLTVYSSEAATATPETTLKREESTDASTAANSHTRQVAAAAYQDAYTTPAPSIFFGRTP